MTRLSLRRLWGSGLGKRLLNTRFDQAMPLFVVGCIFIMLTVAWVQTWEHPLGETSASAPHSDLRELTHVWKAVREWREQNAAVGTSGGDDVTTTGNALAIPRLFHQSWKNKYPPRKFQQWNATCSELYAGPQASAAPTSASSGRSTTGTSTTSGASHPWTFHLWDDTENRQLIQHYFPFFLATYDAFPENIFRADAARYAYMYLFGGMYVDLDTECMASMEPYFSARRAPGVYLAAMATIDKDRHHSVPNAWMASSPGHPFWLLMMANIMGFHASGGYERQGIAEDVTGPAALYATAQHYRRMFPDANDVTILDSSKIFPFSWSKTNMALNRICNAMFKSFNSAACKRRFALQQPYMITYWTHTRRFFKSPVLEEDAAEDTDVIAPNPIAAPIATASEDTVVQ